MAALVIGGSKDASIAVRFEVERTDTFASVKMIGPHNVKIP